MSGVEKHKPERSTTEEKQAPAASGGGGGGGKECDDDTRRCFFLQVTVSARLLSAPDSLQSPLRWVASSHPNVNILSLSTGETWLPVNASRFVFQ